jgi:signal transduction histidine kinase
MVPEFDIKESVQDKLSNDRISLLVGPVTISSLLVYFYLSKGYVHANLIPFFIVISLVILQEIFLNIPYTKKMKYFQSGNVFPLVLYNLAYLVLFTFYVPIYSPLVFVIAEIMFLTVYFRGVLVLFLEIATLTLTVLASYYRNGLPNLPHAIYYPYLLVILGSGLAVIIYRAGAIDGKIRSDLLKASDKIDEEREQLNTLINGIKDSVIATDENGNIIFYNSSSLRLLGQATIEIGAPFTKYVKLMDEKNNLIDFFGLIKPSDKLQNFRNLHILGKNNEIVSLAIDITRVKSIFNSEEKQGIIFLIRDITKEKSLDEARDEFAAVTSHELRTPIATAEANISLAMDKRFMKDLSIETRSRLEKAHQSIIYLADLINQMAELTNIENSNNNVTIEEVDPSKILHQFYNDFVGSVSEKGLALYINIEDGIGTISTSKTYLIEILQNFVTNAIKYTKKGSVTLSVEKSKDVTGAIIFSVSDTGDGISSADKARIFHKFYRAEDYKTMETRGTGLGLYLTLKIAKFINGKIWFNSELNKGSTFFLQVTPMTQNEFNNKKPEPVILENRTKS